MWLKQFLICKMSMMKKQNQLSVHAGIHRIHAILYFTLISFVRLQWQKTQAVVLLAEHVIVNITYKDLFVYLKRYNSVCVITLFANISQA